MSEREQMREKEEVREREREETDGRSGRWMGTPPRPASSLGCSVH